MAFNVKYSPFEYSQFCSKHLNEGQNMVAKTGAYLIQENVDIPFMGPEKLALKYSQICSKHLKKGQNVVAKDMCLLNTGNVDIPFMGPEKLAFKYSRILNIDGPFRQV